jgi:GH18 family chitinase
MSDDIMEILSPLASGDIIARTDGDRVELVSLVSFNSARVLSYLVPGRMKPIGASGGTFVTIRDYQSAARYLYDKGERVFVSPEDARAAILARATEELTS